MDRKKKCLWRFFFVFSLPIILVACRQSGTSKGEFAPDILLRSLSGDAVKLEDYRGKYVMLNFWATWCPPCLEEMPSLEESYERLRMRGFILLAIATKDDADAVRDIKERLGLTFPILLDEEGVVAKAYEVTGYPETFMIDPAGKVASLADPESGVPVSRIVGPRNWASPRALSSLSALLD